MVHLKKYLHIRKKLCCIIAFCFVLLNIICVNVRADLLQNEESEQNSSNSQDNSSNQQQNNSSIDIQAESAILLEAGTGEVIFEKNADVKLPPASITKIMTLILIFDEIDEGKLKLDETVTVSEYAASMGGSQVFLEPMEQQSVDTMIKCIAVASANDACVAFKYRRH